MIVDVIDALSSKNRTVKGWEGKVSLCDLGYCSAGLDEGWEGCGEGVNGECKEQHRRSLPCTAEASRAPQKPPVHRRSLPCTTEASRTPQKPPVHRRSLAYTANASHTTQTPRVHYKSIGANLNQIRTGTLFFLLTRRAGVFYDTPGTQHYVNGTPAINTHNFPDMAELVAYGHSKGLKMGWYFNGCGKEKFVSCILLVLLMRLFHEKVRKCKSTQASTVGLAPNITLSLRGNWLLLPTPFTGV